MTTRRAVLFFALAGALSAQPRRIVSTAPSITEVLYALGLGNRVVGVTTYCHYPPDAATKTKIGTYIEPNLEAIASLRPDLVVIQKNPIQLQAKLERLGLRVTEVSYDSIDEVFQSIAKIGRAAGALDEAQKLNASLQHDLSMIKAVASRYSKRRMMFVVGRAPNRIEDVIAVGRASYLNELIDIAGGRNVFADAVAPYPKVGMEEMLSRNPEVIVDMGDMAETIGVTEAHKRAVVEMWGKYPSLAAVREGRVYAVAADIFVVPGPRMAEAVRAFAKMLHPEAGF